MGAPAYFEAAGWPREPQDLTRHACLLYRFPSTGKLDVWPLGRAPDEPALELPASMVTNTLDPQVCFAEQGLGIACVPEIAVREQLRQGRLVTVLDDYNKREMVFHVLWPSSRQLSPRSGLSWTSSRRSCSPAERRVETPPGGLEPLRSTSQARGFFTAQGR